MTPRPSPPRVLITGAAGNLGGLLARHLLPLGVPLRLLEHHTPMPADLAARAEVVRGDLGEPETLGPVCAGVDCIVHFAGVLFRPWPERFLPRTNLAYFRHLVDAALAQGVGRIILISFPHVEGETTPDHPATGRLDGTPTSVHARTRLEEERYLLAKCQGTATVPVVLRCGMVYGPGILMVEAARWLLRRRLLAVWPRATGIHLVSTPDFLAATTAAITGPGVAGIYHLGDERPVTLQEFLRALAAQDRVAPPLGLPWGFIYLVALGVEVFASIFRTPAPLTRDFVRIGAASYCGDTRRMREELLPHLTHPTLTDGLCQFTPPASPAETANRR